MKVVYSLIYSNLFVALILTCLTWSTYSLINASTKWHVILSVFLGSFMLYNFHRLYKIDFIPEAQRSRRHQWMLSHGNKIKIMMAVSVFMGMLILPNFKASDIVWLVPAGIVSVGYTIPIIPTESKWWRVRDIPLIKPFIISAVVTYLSLCFPIFEHYSIEYIFYPEYLRVFIERSIFLVSMTIPFEMRDTKTDTQAGLKTLATYLGYGLAKRLSFAALVLWMILWSWRYLPNLEWRALAFGGVLFILGLTAINRLDSKNGELFFVITFEGLILIYALGLIALGNL